MVDAEGALSGGVEASVFCKSKYWFVKFLPKLNYIFLKQNWLDKQNHTN